MDKLALLHVMTAMCMGGLTDTIDCSIEGISKPTKKCLYCGEPHNHNNICCSADHYKKWKLLQL